MANNLIQIEIRANDLASGVLKGVNDTLDSMGNSFIKAGGLIAAATAPIAGFLATAVKQASDQETALAQLEARLRSTGGVAGVTAEMASDLADSLSKVTRFSDDAILSGENLLLTFTNISKDVFPDATKTALDMSTALGQSLESSVMQLGKALNDPISGLTALRRVGVQFTDAQEEMIKGMVEAGDLMGAQTLILRELQREFGGAAEAAGNTFAGKLDRLKNKIGEVQERIGFRLIPVLERLVDWVDTAVERVTEWVDKNPELTQTITMVGAALVVVGPALIAIGTAMKVVSVAASGLSLALNVIPTLIGAIGTAIGVLTSPIGIVVIALGGLAQLLGVDIIGWFQGLLGFIQSFPAQLERAGGDIGQVIRNFLLMDNDDPAESFGEMLVRIGDQIGNFLRGLEVNLGLIPFYFQYYFNLIWSKVQPALQPLIDWFTGTGDDSLNGVLAQVGGWVTNNVIDPLKGLWIIVEPYVQDIIDWFNTELLPVFQAVPGWINDNIITPLTGLWEQHLQPIIQPIADFVAQVFQPVFDFIDEILNKAADTIEMLRRIANINSPRQRALPGEAPLSSDTGSGGASQPSLLDLILAAATGGASLATRGGATPNLSLNAYNYPPGMTGTGGLPRYAPGSLSALDGNPYAAQYASQRGYSFDVGGFNTRPGFYFAGIPEWHIPMTDVNRFSGGTEGLGGSTVNVQPGAVVIYTQNGDPEAIRQAVYNALVQLRDEIG